MFGCLLVLSPQKFGHRHWHSEFPRRLGGEPAAPGFWGLNMESLLVRRNMCTDTVSETTLSNRTLNLNNAADFCCFPSGMDSSAAWSSLLLGCWVPSPLSWQNPCCRMRWRLPPGQWFMWWWMTSSLKLKSGEKEKRILK